MLYVGGMPRSGSTLTDLMLHQLPGHVGVGETYYLWRNGVVHDGLCACGERFSDCAFWTEVGRLAFDGWDLALANRVMALQRAVDRTARIPLLLLPWRPRGFARDLEEYSGVLRSLYFAVSEVSGASVVVDSSKRPSLAYVLRTMPDVDLRVVHVVRDPRGVAYSFNKHVPLPPGAGMRSEMPRSSPRKVARRWVTVNGAIAALRRLGVPLTTVRYEDLVDDPRRELGKVLELSRLPATPEAWQFLSAEGVRVPSTHLFAAGRIRLIRGRMPLRRDEDWRSDLASGARRVVDVVTAASRRRYGYR